MKNNFTGAFNIINNFYDRKFVLEHYGIDYNFNSKLYSAVSSDITNIIGAKSRYSVQDAYKFFHQYYCAYPIDYRSFYNYCNTVNADFCLFGGITISDDNDIESLSEDAGKFFSYLKNGKFTDEKNLTLVIDSQNLYLRERYPVLSAVESGQKNLLTACFGDYKEGDGNYSVHDNASGKELTVDGICCNTILVIGSYDGQIINSMKVLLSSGIDEIEYALEFFRLHTKNR